MIVQQILEFLFSLEFTIKLPRGVQVMDVHKDPLVQQVCTDFYNKFYSDQKKRFLILGINPGRLGGGITGIPFTDPVNLEKYCGIKNEWKKQHELSSQFIYDMINAYGGPEMFYNEFYISAVSPLGFVKGNKNLNYYDDKLLLKRIEPFAVHCLKQQLHFGLSNTVCYCVGEGENYKYLHKLNGKYRFFQSIKSLPHPRFIMQYRLKQKQQFIQKYLSILSDMKP
jgi:hypothetical protein